MSFRSHILTGLVAMAAGLTGGLLTNGPAPQKTSVERGVGEKTTCFTPGEDCTQFVVNAIQLAESEVLLQAYNYTSAPILHAVAEAKTTRRLDVRVILDKSNEEARYTGGTYMQHNGVPVLIDDRVRIAHNKVIIIDRKHVLTGSFNFTQAAQKSNAENIIFIRNDPALAKRYVDNWTKRAELSRQMQSAETKTRKPAN